MDLDKRYSNIRGKKCDILTLVKEEPEWAANIIQWYEKKVLELSKPTEADKMQKVKDIITLKVINDFNTTWAYNEIKEVMEE
jgi:hypothetical protein